MATTSSPTVGELAGTVSNRLALVEAELTTLSDGIWSNPELSFEEVTASAAQQEVLERHGFVVESHAAGLETAFVARRSTGAGGPTIGVLGEFDALPGLSQDRVPYRAPLDHPAGHGCGHNLLGTGALGAALVAAAVAESLRIPVDIAYFGCPAEEGGGGKVVMARAGLFAGLDAALSWHPAAFNTLWDGSSLAYDAMSLRFTGRSAHAAVDPENGRSAADAAELMNVGVNYLREHMPADARIHYVVRRAGEAPNVVPDLAVSDYRVRASTRAEVQSLRDRVLDCARGAALMTGTAVSWKLTAAFATLLPNDALGNVLLDALRAVGPPSFDEDDHTFARTLRATVPAGQIESSARVAHVPPELQDQVLHERVDAPFNPGVPSQGSTDVGDVSWNAPTAQLYVATMPIGTPGHSWQLTASSGSGIGRKGMLTAAAALGLAILELAQRPSTLQAVRTEFERRTRGRPYASALPPGVMPRSDLMPARDDGDGWSPLSAGH